MGVSVVQKPYPSTGAGTGDQQGPPRRQSADADAVRQLTRSSALVAEAKVAAEIAAELRGQLIALTGEQNTAAKKGPPT